MNSRGLSRSIQLLHLDQTCVEDLVGYLADGHSSSYVGDSTEAIQAALAKVENASQINDAKGVQLSENLSENDANDAKTEDRPTT